MNADSTTRPPVASAVRCGLLRLQACALLLMLIPVVAFAEGGLPDGWISFDGVTATPTAPRVQIISSSSSEIQLIVSTPGMLCETIEHDGTSYKRLSFPTYFHSTETGYPALPAVRQLLAVPRGCEISVSTTAMDSLLFTDCVVYPVEAEVIRYTEKGWSYVDYEFALNEEAYSRSGGYPSPRISTEAPGSFRGQGVAKLTSYPVRFDASKSEIRVYPELLVALDLSGGSGGTSEELGPFGRIAESLLLGYTGVGGRGSRGPAGPGRWGVHSSVASCADSLTDYLMIVEDSLMVSPRIEQLAEHRARYNGYNVAIVPSATVVDHHEEGVISAAAIHHFIQDLYCERTAEHMLDGRLGYVLLVGDARDEEHGGLNTLLPAHEEADGDTTITTDHWYACVYGDTDWYPDLMVGRLCASDTTELRREVQKFVSYETNASSSDEWRSKMLLTSGFCETSDLGKVVSAHKAFDSSQEILPPSWYPAEEAHANEQSGNCAAQQLEIRDIHVARISSGTHVLELCAHGDTHECDTFNWQAIDDLENNSGQWPFWINYSCMTGAYDLHNDDLGNYDCFGEALMHQEEFGGQPTGALSFFGASENSADAWVDLGLYVWQGLFEHGSHRIGEFLVFAKTKYLIRSGKTDYALYYNLLGDPAIDIMLTDTDGDGYSSAPDYAVRELGLAADPLYPSIGQTVTFRARVENNSNYNPGGAVRVYFEICDADSSSPTLVDSMDIQPAAWDTATASGSWTIPGDNGEIGRRLLLVTVVPQADPDELRTDNNVAALPFGIGFESSDFPVNLWGTEGLPVTVANIDDGYPGLEILGSVRYPGRVVAYSAAREILWTFPAPDGAVLQGPPAVADLDGNGSFEVVICYGENVTVVDGASGDESWQPLYVQGLSSGATIADISDDDGELEVLVERGYQGEFLFMRGIVAIGSDGSKLWDHDAAVTRLGANKRSCISSADLTRDGLCDVATSTSSMNGKSGKLRAIHANGDPFWSVSLGTWSAFAKDPAIEPCNPVILELDGSEDGPEIVCGGHELRCYSSDGNLIGVPWQPDGFLSGIAPVDLDEDGVPELVVTTYGAAAAPDEIQGGVYVLQWDEGSWVVQGSMMTGYACYAQPIVADLNGDGSIEIIVSSWQPHWIDRLDLARRDMTHIDIYTVTAGMDLERFSDIDRPLFFWGSPASTPGVVDTDQDNYFEIWFADGEGMLHCLDLAELEPPVQGKPSRWTCFQHDARHTGVYETPVSGPYPADADVSWWGDYLLTGDVTIDATSSLLVQAGTTVRVVPDADDQGAGVDTDLTELIIHGDMVALGDTLDPIAFMSEAADPASDDWYGIRLRPYSTGELYGCSVTDAFIGIAGDRMDTVAIQHCAISDCDVKGIKVNGRNDLGQCGILIRSNDISDAQIGLYMYHCDATVEHNTIDACGSYGMKIYLDCGSTIASNTITFPVYGQGGNLSGIFIQGPEEDIVVSGNEILEARNCGISYELHNGSWMSLVEHNTIEDSSVYPCSKGISFYDATAIVRWNTIDGKHTALWVDSYCGALPDFGTVTPDSMTPPDTTGHNSIDGSDATYCVWAGPGCETDVMAEGNWWGSDDPSARSFSRRVDWHPFLESPPGRGGDAEDDEVGAQVPFCLVQNSPNPFNPLTSLRFGLPARQAVTLSIYDVAGRCVTTLVDGTLDPGWHDIVWDGRDDAQHRVSSGVYFCRLISQGSTSVKKVVLLK